ncbi:hypothetical protein BDZ97DRAFT_2084193 [Flammula alnicola]|nr:hypothetical protein BDZ97DRAFT_2084193 [Flammula alnicola]
MSRLSSFRDRLPRALPLPQRHIALTTVPRPDGLTQAPYVCFNALLVPLAGAGYSWTSAVPSASPSSESLASSAATYPLLLARLCLFTHILYLPPVLLLSASSLNFLLVLSAPSLFYIVHFSFLQGSFVMQS